MKQGNDKLKLNNEGSAIITVLVIVTFITILATAILYIAVNNFFMKKTEENTRENFYASEVILEEVKANLAIRLSDSYERAYKKVMSNYATYDSAGTRESIYLTTMVDYITSDWNDLVNAAPGADNHEKYNHIISHDLFNEDAIDVPSGAEYELTLADGLVTTYASNGYFILKGVRLKFAMDGYYSEITTDYIINIPMMHFAPDNGTSVPASATDRDEIKYADLVQYTNWKRQ